METDIKKVKLWVQVAITTILLPFSVYLCIFLESEPDNSSKQKWAIGMIAFLIGYWLK
jgi:hypothetical protein